eukprot:GHVT01088884.1.p1 GENE.GHVT01088884.1~~GHVT01088884.1.p1  ORF type:complete len:111 (+),score=8.41 GHVT01088884.1:163-495(+)
MRRLFFSTDWPRFHSAPMSTEITSKNVCQLFFLRARHLMCLYKCLTVDCVGVRIKGEELFKVAMEEVGVRPRIPNSISCAGSPIAWLAIFPVLVAFRSSFLPLVLFQRGK